MGLGFHHSHNGSNAAKCGKIAINIALSSNNSNFNNSSAVTSLFNNHNASSNNTCSS